jgi:hypothetical protein
MCSQFVVVEFDNQWEIGTNGATFPFSGNFVDRAFLTDNIEGLTPMFGVMIDNYRCFDPNAIAYLHITKIPMLLKIGDM